MNILELVTKSLAVLNKAFFDVVVSFTSPTTAEIKAFCKGKLEVGLFPYKTGFISVHFLDRRKKKMQETKILLLIYLVF